MGMLKGARVAVTGAAGTVGVGLIRHLLRADVAEIRALDNNETTLADLQNDLAEDGRLHAFLCDVRSQQHLGTMFQGIDYVFHAAAIKHVPLAEQSPFETVQTNIQGVQNAIQAAIANGVRKLLFMSSDKAVNPTSVMGTSKLMGERLITAANAMNNCDASTKFISTRFGNVAGSRGSVIPLVCDQISKGKPVTLTDTRMTRFVMTLDDAISLVIESLEIGGGGEVFVTKMRTVRVSDLIECLVNLAAPAYGLSPDSVELRVIGPRPGEKFYEELISEEETRRTGELNNMFVVLPAFRNIYGFIDHSYLDGSEQKVMHTYRSEDEEFMSKDEIDRFLLEPYVLPEAIRQKAIAEFGKAEPRLRWTAETAGEVRYG